MNETPAIVKRNEDGSFAGTEEMSKEEMREWLKNKSETNPDILDDIKVPVIDEINVEKQVEKVDKVVRPEG